MEPLQPKANIDYDAELQTDQLYPSLASRFASMLIDQVFLITVLILVGSNIPDSEYSTPIKVGVLLFMVLLYEPTLVAFGCTIGQLITGIRVRHIENTDRRINIVLSVFRAVLKYMLGIISFFVVFANRERRAIHDLGAMSVVVFSDKKKSVA